MLQSGLQGGSISRCRHMHYALVIIIQHRLQEPERSETTRRGRVYLPSVEQGIPVEMSNGHLYLEEFSRLGS